MYDSEAHDIVLGIVGEDTMAEIDDAGVECVMKETCDHLDKCLSLFKRLPCFDLQRETKWFEAHSKPLKS